MASKKRAAVAMVETETLESFALTGRTGLTKAARGALDELVTLRKQGKCGRTFAEVYDYLRRTHGYDMTMMSLRNYMLAQYGSSWKALRGCEEDD